jgi:hypothetical protein
MPIDRDPESYRISGRLKISRNTAIIDRTGFIIVMSQ